MVHQTASPQKQLSPSVNAQSWKCYPFPKSGWLFHTATLARKSVDVRQTKDFKTGLASVLHVQRVYSSNFETIHLWSFKNLVKIQSFYYK